MKKIGVLILTLLFASLKHVFAVCPACTVAVSAGVGLSRWFLIDDLVTGLWIGGFTVSMIIWTISFLDDKNIRFKGRKILTTLIYYALILIPLYTSGIMGQEENVFAFGIDKLLFSIILGSISFFIGANYYEYLKKRNNGRAYFPFQKVVMPIAPLVIFSTIFYFLTK